MNVKLLTVPEVAALARTTPSTVRYWRHIGKGPVGVKVGRRVLYDETDVQSWLSALRAGEAA